jgi:SulP family sulfate permease
MKDEPMQTLQRCGVLDEIGRENFFNMGDDVLGTLYTRLDRAVCSQCRVRVFRPCKVSSG